MSEIGAGYIEPCDEPGGLDTSYLFAVRQCDGTSNIDDFTLESDGVTVATLALISGKQIYQCQYEEGVSSFTVESAGEKAAGSKSYNHTSTIVEHGQSAQNTVNNDDLVGGRHAVIHKTAAGTWRLLHMTNGAKGQVTEASGVTYEEMSGSTITLTSREKNPAYFVPDAIVQTLISAMS